jgi:hypothetical protein
MSNTGGTQQSGTGLSRELDTNDGFVDKYGIAIAAVFVALWVTALPIVNLLRAVPLFKEIVIGAAVVVVFTSLDDWGQGAKYALVSGMAGAILFNLTWIPASFVVGLSSAGGAESAAMLGALGALGAFANVVGLLFMSPVGYLAGGALGGALR